MNTASEHAPLKGVLPDLPQPVWEGLRAQQSALAPTGVLRASLNLGNPLLAQRDAHTGALSGIAVDLAALLARAMGVGLHWVQWPTAAASVQAVEQGIADFGFFATDPQRAQHLAFTRPYLLIEGGYVVHENANIHSVQEVDRPGTVVTVGAGSAYDLYLSRTLQHAQLERAPSSPAVLDHFLAHAHDVAAGVREQIAALAQEKMAAGGPALRLLPGHFMLIRQALGVQRSRGDAVAAALDAFVQAALSAGAVQALAVGNAITGARVADAGGDI